VYFSVASFPEYGKLSGNRAADQLVEAVRDVVVDANKRDPRDFALWKKDDKHLMQWYSPFGRGFPGWHIECSVMAAHYLGVPFDIHGGGEDLIFPHHECEIAQAESLTGEAFARSWVHTRFLQVEGEKMSKRAGNFLTVRDLTRTSFEGGSGVDPLALRLALISGHYRKPFNFTYKNLKDSAKIVARYKELTALIEAAVARAEPGPDRLGDRLEATYERTLDALLDDLNTPEALAAALAGGKLVQGFGDRLNGAEAERARAWLSRINDLLGIVAPDAAPPADAASEVDPITEQVEALLSERAQARKARDFARSDAIREELTAMGIEVMDTPNGPKWQRVPTV
jgi:cysteinyl-tRNA synthetase